MACLLRLVRQRLLGRLPLLSMALNDRLVFAGAFATAGLAALGVEGERIGEWALVDLGDVIVHLMQPAVRKYYGLEEIWGGKPVKLKVDTAPVKLVKASEEPAPAPITPATPPMTA